MLSADACSENPKVERGQSGQIRLSREADEAAQVWSNVAYHGLLLVLASDEIAGQ